MAKARAEAVEPILILGLFALDRMTKAWAVDWLMPRGSVELLPFLSLTYVENTGAAFGLGQNRNVFFIIVALGLFGGLLYVRRRWAKKDPWLRAGTLLACAGALGNLYDRIAYGYVVDFVDLRVWPVFNVADSCVTVGACCLAWGMRDSKT